MRPWEQMSADEKFDCLSGEMEGLRRRMETISNDANRVLAGYENRIKALEKKK